MDKIEVTQWRKKPVVVEAMKYPGHTVTGVDTLLAFEDWIEPLAKAAGRWPLTYRGQSLIIPTLEGDHEAKPGDYIIRGVSGEIYPCKPDIFAKTYEPALATKWALAELRGKNRYDNPQQALDCFDKADAALAPFTKGQNDAQ